MKTNYGKRGFEFSFGWMFAIIVGAVIIFLAIYAATSFVREGRNVQDTFAGKELGILLNPVETSLESSKTSSISFPVQTRVYNDCSTSGNFGSQKISIASKSGVGEQWQKPGVPSTFYNKYMFSKSIVEGKQLYVFVKPFEFPYKVGDLLFIWSDMDEYCFIDAPNEIEDDITDLNIKNVNSTLNIGQCSKKSIKVCFNSGAGCDIIVNTVGKSVKKNGQTLQYIDDRENTLLYGAIFSDPEVYECQVKRLMKRTAELALLYKVKSESLSPRGCSSNLESDLLLYVNQTLSLNSSSQLQSVANSADELGGRNNALSCKLF